MTSYIVAPYASPPSSGVYYVYDRLQHAGFVPQAYAAEGIGFAIPSNTAKQFLKDLLAF